MFFSSESEIIYIKNLPNHMDSNSDEINHDVKKGIKNHETNDASTANAKINNNDTPSICNGSVSKNGISRINSTSAAHEVMEKGTTNEEILSLETDEEKRYRRRSLYINFVTMFFNSVGYGMLNPSIWPYINKVCSGRFNLLIHIFIRYKK